MTNSNSPRLSRRALVAAALLAVVGVTTAQAAVSIKNLRGTWRGPYIRESDSAQVAVKLVISKDEKKRGGARLIGADLTIGNKTYKKLIGGFEPVTQILNLSQLPNPRNPQAPLAVFGGKVAADGKSFETSAAVIAVPGSGSNIEYVGTASRR